MHASQTNTQSLSQAHEIKENSEQLHPLMSASLESFFLLSFSPKLWATLEEGSWIPTLPILIRTDNLEFTATYLDFKLLSFLSLLRKFLLFFSK